MKRIYRCEIVVYDIYVVEETGEYGPDSTPGMKVEAEVIFEEDFYETNDASGSLIVAQAAHQLLKQDQEQGVFDEMVQQIIQEGGEILKEKR
jgi:hypothetical protein